MASAKVRLKLSGTWPLADRGLNVEARRRAGQGLVDELDAQGCAGAGRASFSR